MASWLLAETGNTRSVEANMKNRKKTKSDQIAKLEKAIKKYGDYDGKRSARLAELRGQK